VGCWRAREREPNTKPPTKFEVFSSSSFGVIDAAMVDMTLNNDL